MFFRKLEPASESERARLPQTLLLHQAPRKDPKHACAINQKKATDLSVPLNHISLNEDPNAGFKPHVKRTKRKVL